MNSEHEIRLRTALHGAALPTAPASLYAVLDAVTAEPVLAGSDARHLGLRTGRRSWGIVAVAAVLLVGGAIALSVGTRGPEPTPSLLPSLAPSASSEPATATRVTYEPQWTTDVPFDVDDLAAIVAIAQQRIDATGAVGVVVSTDDEARVVVDIPPGIDPEPLRSLVGTTGSAAFVPVGREPADIGVHLDRRAFPPLFDGRSIVDASRDIDSTGLPGLLIRLDDDAAATFSDYTAAHIAEWVAITIDDVVVSAPMINERIPDGAVFISLDVAAAERQDLDALVALLQNGPLPVPLVEVANGPAPSPEAAASPAIQCEAPLDVEGPQLDCDTAVRQALAILPVGHPAIAKVGFVHDCNDVRFQAIPDCFVQAFGVVTVTFVDGSQPVRIGLSLGSPPSIIPPLPTPSG